MVGDEVLKCFVDRAVQSIRQASDWIARYGGEEFAIVLPHTGRDGAQAVAEKLRSACASTAFMTGSGLVEVTVSLGVATLSGIGDTKAAMTDILSRADAALYRSKREGRNRVSA